ncbi:hypothetical protein SNE40_021180 [Patella caerulea]|uniref:Uncharacterized protein n=1 Tax=Patella caerulea TaxID=87958 RepID=A0AAN8IYV8_PATCE
MQEWKTDPARILRTVKRIKVNNFASENKRKKFKEKVTAIERAKKSAESLRDHFIRMIVVVAQSHIIDLKSQKSALLNKLERIQTDIVTNIQGVDARIFDRGLLIHSVLSIINVGTVYASIARRILSIVCSGRENEVHVCLDKYIEHSIKDSEKKLRGAEDWVYTITGGNQKVRQRGGNS